MITQNIFKISLIFSFYVATVMGADLSVMDNIVVSGPVKLNNKLTIEDIYNENKINTKNLKVRHKAKMHNAKMHNADIKDLNVHSITAKNGFFKNISASGSINMADLTVSNIDILNNASVSNIDALNATINSLTLSDNLTVSNLDVLNNASVSNLDALNATINSLTLSDNLTVSNLDVLNNELVGGNLSVNGSVSACDVLVSCNLLMGDSTTNLVGNVVKNGAYFIHNSGENNTFVGSLAGNFTATGQNNTAVGTYSSTDNTTGSSNSSFGAFTLNRNTSGSNNVAFGTNALAGNNGNANTAIGYDTLGSATTAAYNVAIGAQAQLFNMTGQENVVIGTFGLQSLTSGNDNTVVGTSAGVNLPQGSSNIIIGRLAGSNLASNVSNNIVIGNASVANDANTIRIGDTAVQNRAFVAGIRGVTTASASAIPVMIDANSQLGTISSSKRFKSNIRDIGSISSLIMSLRPVMFNYDADQVDSIQYGLIAEEVARVYPELVVFDENGKPYTVKYHLLYALLLNEIQKNRSFIDNLKDNQDSTDQLLARIVALEHIINKK